MFASINVLAPTSALTIIINAILAKIYFNEKLSIKGIIGSILIMIGCVISILFGSHHEDDFVINDFIIKAEDSHFIMYSILDIFLILMCIIISIKMHSKNNNESFQHGIRAVLMCFSAAGVAGWVQIFGKICADLIFDTLIGNNQFNSMLSWLMLFICASFIFMELYMISEMMRIFDAVK